MATSETPADGGAGGPSSPTLGSVLTSEALPADDPGLDAAADQALLERPPFSIRTRLLLAFSVFFLFSLGITLWAIGVLAQVQQKIIFLEVVDDYTSEVQRARRLEKNFLLYGTNLEDARDHTRTAEALLEGSAEQFRETVGDETLAQMRVHLAAYSAVLDGADPEAGEEELREHGSALLTQALDLAAHERAHVNTMLTLTRRVPLFFLGALLVLSVFLFAFVYRHLHATLTRFMAYTQRIASGDLSPIAPAREFRDEFSSLAVMINRMVRELDRQHHILVESHKLRAMGTLVAGVAHELNNPINNILLTASVMQEEADTIDRAEHQEMLEDVVSQAERAKEIVRNLLDFARESDTHIEAIDLREILAQTVRLAGNQAKMKGVAIDLEVPDSVPSVHGDSHLLGQVFLNLILNALDALPEGGRIHIRFDAERQEDLLAVDVSDDGPGMPTHVMSRIFDPFFTTKPQGKGTGLGLSVSRGIVRKLGGYLRVRSRIGEGSTFTVLLPVTTVPFDPTSRAGRGEASDSSGPAAPAGAEGDGGGESGGG